jgi:16S rRNA (guanine527-N7)-methyltransferase
LQTRSDNNQISPIPDARVLDLLAEGLLSLCQNDPVVESIFTPRREEIIALLEAYLGEIMTHNPALSLVGTNDPKELVVRHILDSLAPLGIISNKINGAVSRIADVGSGAGLPGIPLAIALPDSEFTLIERKGRRAGFLKNTLAALAGKNHNIFSKISVEEQEMEKVKPRRFTLVTFRALKPLEPKILKKLFRLCVKGGVLAAYKGRRSKVEAEIAELERQMPGQTIRWELIPCPVPMLDEERHLLIIKEKNNRE